MPTEKESTFTTHQSRTGSDWSETTISRHRNCIRGPQHIVEQITRGGWAHDCDMIAHRWTTTGADGAETGTGLWFEAKYKTIKAAKWAQKALWANGYAVATLPSC